MYKQPFLLSGLLLGIGLGGFIDGIVFHQILQLHSMVSARLPQDSVVNIKISMVWDGLFHLFTWLTVVLGLGSLWRAAKQKDRAWSGRVFWGCLLAGWGIFNCIEGIIDHYLLQVHHVVERLGLSIYDHIFIGSGFLLVLLGRFLYVSGNRNRGSSLGRQ
jgi:uncharacterized membrane protein